MFGILNINKPQFLTSRQVVNQVVGILRKIGGPKTRVGHAGTLDPLATGVLLVCIGPATRLIQYIHRHPKLYDAEFLLGQSSNTDDVFGEVLEMQNAPKIESEQVANALTEFVGEIQQVPPDFSAVRVDGRRAYELARKGHDVQLSAKTVTIDQLELLGMDYPKFRLRIKCGSGTYIRSLGRDLAKRLGSQAVMSNLVRTAVADFSISDAHDVKTLNPDNLQQSLCPARRIVADLPQFVISDEKVADMTNGHFVRHSEIEQWNDLSVAQRCNLEQASEIAVMNGAGGLVAIMQRFDPTIFRPGINFAHYWMDENQIRR